MRQALKVLVVGTGRCGSGFLANALNESGQTCGHETIFNHWNEAVVYRQYQKNTKIAESAWPASPFIGSPWLDPEIKIVHLMRDPMKVIRSFYDLNFFSIERHHKPLNHLVYLHSAISPLTEDRLISSAQHYYEWNTLITQRLAVAPNPRMTVKFEDIITEGTTARADLEDFLGIELSNTGRIVNAKKQEKSVSPKPFNADLALQAAEKLAELYGDFGYSLSPEPMQKTA